MVLRKIFGPRRDEVTGEGRRLHNEELNDLYCSPNTVRVIKCRRMRWAGHVSFMGEGREVYRVLVGKPEGRRPVGRPRRRWMDNIPLNHRYAVTGLISRQTVATYPNYTRPCLSVLTFVCLVLGQGYTLRISVLFMLYRRGPR